MKKLIIAMMIMVIGLTGCGLHSNGSGTTLDNFVKDMENRGYSVWLIDDNLGRTYVEVHYNNGTGEVFSIEELEELGY